MATKSAQAPPVQPPDGFDDTPPVISSRSTLRNEDAPAERVQALPLRFG